MIKREVATVLKDIAPHLSEETFVLIFNTFVADSNDAIRIPLMEALVSLSRHLAFASMQKFIQEQVLKLSTDVSWRIRLTVADKAHELVAVNKISTDLKKFLVEIFAKLFEDQEAEVRNSCCVKLEPLAEKIGKEEFITIVLQQLAKVEKDSVSYVRGSLAATLLRICSYVGKSKTNDFIFPVFLNLIKDESHEIRMTIIKNLDRLHEVINIDVFVQSIIPSFIEISSNKSWRTRIQITESIPVLARILVSYTLIAEKRFVL